MKLHKYSLLCHGLLLTGEFTSQCFIMSEYTQKNRGCLVRARLKFCSVVIRKNHIDVSELMNVEMFFFHY